MNQILITESIYVTPKLKRQKKFYKISFVLCLLAVITLSIYYICLEIEKYKQEEISEQLVNSISFDKKQPDVLVIALEEPAEEIIEENLEEFNDSYTAASGRKYMVDSILNIPSLDINYAVLSETTTESLKISLTKFWGGDPNTVGNYCIVGHNYDGKDIFFGKLNKIQNDDIVELQDKSGKVLRYKVYNKYIVKPTDVECTSQLTNGKKELTLITCSDGGKTRLIVKCRAKA